MDLFAKPFAKTLVKPSASAGGDTVLLRFCVRDARMAFDERHTSHPSVRCAHCGALVDRHLYVIITGVLTIDGLGDTPLDERLRVCVECYGHMCERARHSPLWRDPPTSDDSDDSGSGGPTGE